MKHQYFHLIWFLFLTKPQKEKYNSLENLRTNVFKDYGNSDFTDVNVILDFLFTTSFTSVSTITHTRKNIFNVNPRCKEDFIYIIYIENYRFLNELTYLQRILLSRIIFQFPKKQVTFNNKPIESIVDPIVIEVSRV